MSEYRGHERLDLPPPVDFLQIAAKALDGRIFERHMDMVALNADPQTRPSIPYPESLLEATYGNGPAMIQRYGEDVPTAVMNRLRKNNVSANKLLLPSDQVMAYFHHRFFDYEVFGSDGMRHALDMHYSPRMSFAPAAPDPRSFQLEGRATTNRSLFTREEENAATRMAQEHPTVPLAVIGYQGIILDYLNELGGAFSELSMDPANNISPQDISAYYEFTRRWDTGNFLDVFLPAIAIFAERAKQQDAYLPEEDIFTLELFQQAVKFTIRNGAFRNFVTIPAHVADNKKERINHFLCPAVGAVREQLVSGALLHTIYSVASRHHNSGDPAAMDLAVGVSRTAARAVDTAERTEAYRQREAEEAACPVVLIETEGHDWPEIAGSAISRALEKRKPASFSYDSIAYEISPAAIESAFVFETAAQLGDVEVEVGGGGWWYGVLSSTIEAALATGRPHFFVFNGTAHRIDPAQVQEFLAQFAPRN